MPRRRKQDDVRGGEARRDRESPYVVRPKRPCPVCTDKVVCTYKDIAFLARFVSDRGKIVSRSRTGVCSKHQRVVTREIKRARHLALLPFVVGPQ